MGLLKQPTLTLGSLKKAVVAIVAGLAKGNLGSNSSASTVPVAPSSASLLDGFSNQLTDGSGNILGAT